jgi:hypothetical protein
VLRAQLQGDSGVQGLKIVHDNLAPGECRLELVGRRLWGVRVARVSMHAFRSAPAMPVASPVQVLREGDGSGVAYLLTRPDIHSAMRRSSFDQYSRLENAAGCRVLYSRSISVFEASLT